MAAPRSIAIIPDGNRRWAKARKKLDIMGHKEGLINCRKIARAAFDLGTAHVVLWAASISNLEKRDPKEIAHLFGLLKQELLYREENPDNAVFHLCGAWQRYNTDKDLPRLVARAETKTAGAGSKHFTVLFGYDGMAEFVAAVQSSSHALVIDEITLRRHSWTAHVPNIDLLIRTGVEGDPHLSDLFLPFQTRNTQLHFSELCWPDFSPEELGKVFADYEKRQRRLGA